MNVFTEANRHGSMLRNHNRQFISIFFPIYINKVPAFPFLVLISIGSLQLRSCDHSYLKSINCDKINTEMEREG